MNNSYLVEIRSKSCYPAFRKFVDFATTIVYIFAALAAVGGLGAGINGQTIGFLLGPLGAALIYVVGRVAEEISLMIVDIADATIETAGRGRNGPGQLIGQGVVRSKPSEPANRRQVPEIKQTEAVPLKDRKRPDIATLSNNMYCLYLTEKYEIKENETLKKFWVRGADDMFNSLKDALEAAHEMELQEQAQANLDAEKRRVAIEKGSASLKENDTPTMRPNECIEILNALGFAVSNGIEENTWMIQQPSGINVNIRSIKALHEMTVIYMQRANKRS